MNSDLHAHYIAVLTAESADRERYCAEIKRLQTLIRQKDTAIAALRASIAADEDAARVLVKPLPFAQPVGLGAPAHPDVPANLLYASISVRWGILSLMADHTPPDQAIGTPEMAEALVAGGVRSGGVNFAANVSAVVSDMAKNRHELESVGEGKYRITAHGREVWQGIKTTRQYRNRRYGWVAQEG